MTQRDFAIDVVRQLRQAGFQALWAGGCVRDQLLGLTPKVVFSICADRNGYVATHNRKHCVPQRGDPAWDAAHSRYRRLFNDRTGLASHERETVELSPEHAALLAADPRASAFWAEATPTYRKLCTVWVTSAKQETTRDRRIAQLVDDCAHGRLVKNQRYGDPPRWLERAAEAARRAAG